MADDTAVAARRLRVSGQVQGVGFRPFVYHLARRLGVKGWVCNEGAGVRIQAQGSAAQLATLRQALQAEAPVMAVIETIVCTPAAIDPALADFTIRASETGAVPAAPTPDAALCGDCLRELFDPADRRYRYPFINCTHCGPRYTLIKRLPYDRPLTTMAPFHLCPRCAWEYHSPQDRRFHAQPNACGDCGPQLSFVAADGRPLSDIDPIAETFQRIQAGEIIAIKGIGGFHLVCDAANADAVARLRARKQRKEKPFALMAANARSLHAWVELSDSNRQRLVAQDAPILLCPLKDPQALPGIAPGLAWCGVMLPHAPLHYLLFHQAAGCPPGLAWLQQSQPLLLVMTSGNRGGDPLVTDNDQALRRLAGIADGFLLHNRDIRSRCDDSVLNGLADPPALIRRGRGLAPQVIALAQSGPPVLACGAFFKNTVCLTKGNRAYVSPHIGDLDNPDCCRALAEAVDHLKALLEIEPALVVSDRHPDFFSSQFARRYSQAHRLPLLEVQHHHAHIAAVMAEHRLRAPVIGLALDGLGLGSDGSLWGGELLRVDTRGFRRLSHLSPLPLPGGERAAREPWRMAAGALYRLGLGGQIPSRFADQPGAALTRQLLERGLNCPPTSSAGRLFDAVAGLLGVSAVAAYEAQAAMRLESLAYRYRAEQGWPREPRLLRPQAGQALDLRPLLRRIAAIEDAAYGAALFHRQLILGLSDWVAQACAEHRLDGVVLAGGCFLNQLLSQGLTAELLRRGLKVYRARQLPCNDGGISLGQAQVALCQSVDQGPAEPCRQSPGEERFPCV